MNKKDVSFVILILCFILLFFFIGWKLGYDEGYDTVFEADTRFIDSAIECGYFVRDPSKLDDLQELLRENQSRADYAKNSTSITEER